MLRALPARPIAPPVGAAPGTFRLALDIGHTLRSGGAMSAAGVMEYQFNKEAVERIRAHLEEQLRIDVFVVDKTGASISLMERPRRAAQARANLFLAVHHDSANDRYLVPVNVNGRVLKQSTRFAGYSVFYSQKNPNPAQSLRFARALGAAMRRQGLTPTLHHADPIPGENRDLVDPEFGVYRYDDLVVLKRATMPAVLLECGVIINPDEERQLREPERQMQTARAVGEAIVEINRGPVQSETDAKPQHPPSADSLTNPTETP